MTIKNRALSVLLAAAVAAPSWTLPLAASAASKGKSTFECEGIGRGQHKKGMTQKECRELGGTVRKTGAKSEEPAERKAAGSAERKATRAPRRSYGRSAEPAEAPDSGGREYQGEKFSCRGIGTGHHYKGMTPEECRNMGGTVEAPRGK